VHGVDFTTGAPGQDLSDGNGHGTHVAGIIAAAANGVGVVGVAPKAKIMVVKVLDAQLAGTTVGVAEAIRYAAANGARIINLSLRGTVPDPRLNEAIAAAAAANVLVVVGAGNDARDIDTQPVYPASIAAPNLVSVAATTPQDGRAIADFSNFGQLTVQLAAPGDAILSTSNTGGWIDESGTSMASPMVAGVAALMLGANPRLSAADLRALLLQNAVRAPLRVSAGYVDALRSVVAASTAVDGGAAQAPRLRVLRATGKTDHTDVQAAVVGATAAIRRYVVRIDGRPVARLTARSSPFTVKLRRRGTRVSIHALDGSGRVVARAAKAVSALGSGKSGASGGAQIGA
jgi:subtilisin family serine protease